MSFRVRVLALTMLIAVMATAATAWLTLREASRQITESVTADQRQVTEITTRLAQYGMNHGGWAGVDEAVTELAAGTGQRIRVVTESGATLADSDVLGGRAPRPSSAPPVLVDARAPLYVPAGRFPGSAVKVAAFHVGDYRTTARLAACLSEAGSPPSVTAGPDGGLVLAVADKRHPAVATCSLRSESTDAERRDDLRAMDPCGQFKGAELAACLQASYARLIDDFAPPLLQVYIGAKEERPQGLPPGPVVAAASIVAVVALVGALLLSRRVLRPIGALTKASARLAEGDLSQRVPVAGHDELAGLARSFNGMADSLQRSEERQRRLVADVAHELRTPLANLRGYIEAVRDGVIPIGPEVLASLHEEAVLQQRIVDDLQDLALAEAGQLAYHRTRVDLAELVQTCRTAHLPAATAAGVELRTWSGAPTWVDGDPDRLRQVIGNLVTNALRATPAGGTVTLSVTVEGADVNVRVVDSGSGIAAADLPHVFDRFWRADAARGRQTGGGGLGLAIARQITMDHGGRITVESEPARGTTFTVTLPATR